MSSIIYDADAWHHYPQHRWTFNKLELAMRLGYIAGPAGIKVPSAGEYIVRPVYNLSGMGVSSRFEWLDVDDEYTVKPGEFWCERFVGTNLSIDYSWQDNVLVPTFATRGYRTSPELYRFNCWQKINPPRIELPDWIHTLHDVANINIEFIGSHIIEVHLRAGVDFPDNATQLIVVWEDSAEDQHRTMQGRSWQYIEAADDADGHLKVKRLGFYYR